MEKHVSLYNNDTFRSHCLSKIKQYGLDMGKISRSLGVNTGNLRNFLTNSGRSGISKDNMAILAAKLGIGVNISYFDDPGVDPRKFQSEKAYKEKYRLSSSREELEEKLKIN